MPQAKERLAALTTRLHDLTGTLAALGAPVEALAAPACSAKQIAEVAAIFRGGIDDKLLALQMRAGAQ